MKTELKLSEKLIGRDKGCYYLVTFYNGVERIMKFNGTHFEGFESDLCVNNEIDFWQEISLTSN